MSKTNVTHDPVGHSHFIMFEALVKKMTSELPNMVNLTDLTRTANRLLCWNNYGMIPVSATCQQIAIRCFNQGVREGKWRLNKFKIVEVIS